MLEKWENAVMKINNNGQVWRATRYSFVCSNHFERLNHIVPSTNVKETCRLKKMQYHQYFQDWIQIDLNYNRN
jgi:hypothetical protein